MEDDKIIKICFNSYWSKQKFKGRNLKIKRVPIYINKLFLSKIQYEFSNKNYIFQRNAMLRSDKLFRKGF